MRTILVALTALLCAGSAVAGNFSGFYAGAHGGYVWGDASTTDDPADWGNNPVFIGPFNYNLNGAFGGGTLGVNWQQRAT